jgi:hypothetical protein
MMRMRRQKRIGNDKVLQTIDENSDAKTQAYFALSGWYETHQKMRVVFTAWEKAISHKAISRSSLAKRASRFVRLWQWDAIMREWGRIVELLLAASATADSDTESDTTHSSMPALGAAPLFPLPDTTSDWSDDESGDDDPFDYSADALPWWYSAHALQMRMMWDNFDNAVRPQHMDFLARYGYVVNPLDNILNVEEYML